MLENKEHKTTIELTSYISLYLFTQTLHVQELLQKGLIDTWSINWYRKRVGIEKGTFSVSQRFAKTAISPLLTYSTTFQIIPGKTENNQISMFLKL